jgi:hypothetical protein
MKKTMPQEAVALLDRDARNRFDRQEHVSRAKRGKRCCRSLHSQGNAEEIPENKFPPLAEAVEGGQHAGSVGG